jgi:regulator of replication initiation timing
MIDAYREELESLLVERDALRAECERLRKTLERVVKLDAHGCLTRDCPHKTGRECAEELATVLAEMIDRARYAIEKARGTR